MSANQQLVAQKRDAVRTLFDKCKGQISAALPKHMTPERMARIAFSAVQRQPLLLECTEQSLALSVIQCSELGLEPNLLGHAYLVPFKNYKQGTVECTMIPGYKGLVKLAYNTGEVSYIDAVVVREGDHFEYERGLEPKLVHKPIADADSAATHVYAVIHFKDGGRRFDVMTKSDVEKVRARSKAKDSGPWVSDWDEMAKKTVLKRAFKLVPMSSELERAITYAEQEETGLPQASDMVDLGPAEIIEPQAPAAGGTKSRVKDKLKADAPQQPAQEAAEPPKQEAAVAEIPAIGTGALSVIMSGWSDGQKETYEAAMKRLDGIGYDMADAHEEAYQAALKVAR